jgi:hypothetical protein
LISSGKKSGTDSVHSISRSPKFKNRIITWYVLQCTSLWRHNDVAKYTLKHCVDNIFSLNMNDQLFFLTF